MADESGSRLIEAGISVHFATEGEFTVVVATYGGSPYVHAMKGSGMSRKPKNALSYALEDLAQQMRKP